MRLSSPPLVLAFVVSGVVSSVASAFTPASTFLVSTVHHRSSHSSSSSSSSSSSNLFMKTIAVFGASGLTSREVIYQALESGDRVVGLTRNPSNVKIPEGSGGESKSDLPIVNDDMTIVGGDVTKMSDVNAAFDAAGSDGVDGVVIALGGKTKDVGNTMLTDGTENVMAVMKERGIKRLAVVTVSLCVVIIILLLFLGIYIFPPPLFWRLFFFRKWTSSTFCAHTHTHTPPRLPLPFLLLPRPPFLC